MSSDCIQYQCTTASWCPPTPLSISHTGSSSGSLQVVPSVTGVGHCGFKSCTRDNSLTIFRCFGGRTTADSYREDTVKTTQSARNSSLNHLTKADRLTPEYLDKHKLRQIEAHCLRPVVLLTNWLQTFSPAQATSRGPS